jgi:SSS family solute:Na+ symporter
VVDALTIFYSLLTVSLFVPILAGLYAPRASTPDALAAIACGVTAMLIVQFTTGAAGIAGITPALAGLLAAVAGFVVVYGRRAIAMPAQRAEGTHSTQRK